MVLVVLLMLIFLCLSAFSFASSATSGVAENSMGVMGDVIGKGNNTANTRASSNNIAEFTFRNGNDYLTVKYPKKITIKLGDEIGANTDNSPRTSGMYNIDSQTNEQPNLVLEGHFGDAGNSDYQQIIRTGVWGFNGLNGNTLFNEYFNNYDFHTERNNYRGGGAVGSVGGNGVQFAVNTWDGADNNWVLCINNSGNFDGLDTVVWPQGTAKKAGTAVYTMPSGNGLVQFRNYHKPVIGNGYWQASNSGKFTSYPNGTPTITINVLDPEGLQNVINDAQNRKNNIKGVVEKALITELNNAIAEANNWVTKARDYRQNFDISQESLELAKNRINSAIANIENSQSYGVVNGGQYCTSTEFRISKATYDAANGGDIAYINGVSNKISTRDFKWRADSKFDGEGYYYYTFTNNSTKIENTSVTFTIAGTDKRITFNITSWHGFADVNGNLLANLSKDSVNANGQLITCANTSHTCRMKVNSLDNGQKIQCQHTWSKTDVESNTELWAHTYGEEQTTPSTCITKGERYHTCACGHKEVLGSLELNPNNHASLDESKLVWVAGQKVPGTEAELTEAMHCGYAGKYGHLCSACNKYANEVEKPAGETPTGTISCDYNGQSIVVTTPPTCHSLGEGHRVCKNCSHTQKAVEPSEAETAEQLKKLPHNYDKSNLVVDKKPTCTEKGTGHFVCTNEGCNATTTEGVDPNHPDLQPKGHDVDRTKVILDTPPTCSSYGVGHYKCKNCEYIEKINNPQSVPELQTTAHVFSEVLTFETRPTCTENGKGHYKCTGKNCLETKVADPETTPELKAKGHTRPLENEPNNLVYDKEPTCTTDGTGHYVCKECQTNVSLSVSEEPKLKATGHNVDGQKIVVTTPPTCHSLGEGHRLCKKCNAEVKVEQSEAETAEELKLREHTLGELIIDTAPTCTVDGKGHYECTANGCSHRVEAEVSKEPTLQQTGHDFDRITVIVDVEPTCHKLGEGHYKCKKCDATEKITNPESVTELQKKEHVFSNELTIDIAPTCTDNGTGHYKCTNTECTETKPADPNSVTELQATGHKRPEINTDGHFVEDTAPTCTTDGTGHYVCATCKTNIPLTIEEEPKLNKTGHNVEGQTIVVTKEPTCYSLGEGHRLCKKCNAEVKVEQSEAETAEELKLREHVLDTSIKQELVAPTCTKNGSAKYYCKEHNNGCTYSEAIVPTKENGLSALGHNYDGAKLNVDKVATCMEEGLGHKYCTNPNCDDHEGSKKVVTLPKDNKNHVFDESKGSKKMHQDGVCTDPKSSYDYLTCANPNCSGVIKVIEGTQQAGEHKWSTILTITKKPTCQAEGEGHYKCTKCSKTKQAVVSETPGLQKLSHKYVEKVDNKYQKSPATCESPAVYYKSCSACGEKHVSETFVNGKALGHSFTKYQSNNDATCHKNATETAKCDRCDKTDTREIPNSMLAHNWEFTEKVAPSLENKTNGYDLYTCSLCGETKKENIVKWETLLPDGPKFTVTIEGGTADGQTTVQVNANGTITVKAEVPEGKVFVGWSDGNNIISYKAEDTIQVTGNMTLTAVFDDVVQDGQGANNSTVIGSAIGGTVVALLLVGIIIAIVVIVKKRKA